METKKIWEDWIFFFSLKNESWSIVDLNWYSYSIVIEKKGWTEILREGWEITQTAQELIKTIPASETQNLTIWQYYIEYKITDTNDNTFITDKILFEVISTLHYN